MISITSLFAGILIGIIIGSVVNESHKEKSYIGFIMGNDIVDTAPKGYWNE